MLQVYVKTQNNNVVILNGSRHSFRCRQRNKGTKGQRDKDKKHTFRFISYKTMLSEKNNQVYGPHLFYSISKL
jgi:hypothetical protein